MNYEGQEEATIDFDDTIQITPFNMREEMEEGHFDSTGTYIFDRTKVNLTTVLSSSSTLKVFYK